MAATDLFDFINDLYDLLPEQDRVRFGELWTSYEQTYGDIWTRLLQSQLSSVISTLPLHNIKRWLEFEFSNSNQVNLAATYTTTQGIAGGADLSVKQLIKFSIDGAPPIEVDLVGIDPTHTTNIEIVSKINAAAGFNFATLVVDGALIQFTSSTRGSSSSIEFLAASSPTMDASAIVLGIIPANLPLKVPKFPFAYQLPDSNIASIPSLQNKIRVESVTLTLIEGTDYKILDNGVITFLLTPEATLWAQNTLYNFETPYNNFGFLIDFYDKNSPNYLKAVKGLWFAFWTGPRPENIRRSLYLLFGLPTASQVGTVTALSSTSITLTYQDGTTETFAIPLNLFAVVSLNSTVQQFEPLVSGIDVLDKVNSPGFLAREVGRAGVDPFLTQFATFGVDPDTDESRALKTVEQNTYLVQVDVNTFVNVDINLANVRSFLTNMQPKSRTFLNQILVGPFNDLITLEESLIEEITYDVTPNVDSNQNTLAQQSDLDDAETNPDTGIKLDSDAFTFNDYLDTQVYHGITLVDTFHIEG
jgi:hypothetical protein